MKCKALRTLGVWRLMLQALVTGGITGAVIGLFRQTYTLINTAVVDYVHGHSLSDPLVGLSIFVALVLLGLLAWQLLRHEPLISGSGIPQVELTVAGHLPMRWVTVIWAKFVGTLVSLSGGLSVGREGPCIQMGAAVGCGVGRIWHDDKAQTMPRYLIGGSVAGLTAAFGAPAAGLCFAFEEMKTVISAPMLLFAALAAASAWFVIEVLFGFGRVFPFHNTGTLSLLQWWIVPLLGGMVGMLGAAYNAILIRLTHWADRSPLMPQPVRVLAPFLISGLLLYFYPQVLVGFGPGALDLEGLALPLGRALAAAGRQNPVFLRELRLWRGRRPAHAYAARRRVGRRLRGLGPALPELHRPGTGRHPAYSVHGRAVCLHGARAAHRRGPADRNDRLAAQRPGHCGHILSGRPGRQLPEFAAGLRQPEATRRGPGKSPASQNRPGRRCSGRNHIESESRHAR